MSTRSRREASKRVIRDDSSDDDTNNQRRNNNSNQPKDSNTSNVTVDKNKVNKLETITGLSHQEAIQLLQACNNDLEMAINLQFSEAAGSSKISNSKASISEDDVRAPIPQKIEKLLDYDPYEVPRATKRPRAVFESFRDLQQEFDDGDDTSKSKKRSTLAQLFRPPLDIVYSGTFETAKIVGAKKSKWILVDIQNQSEFECQLLNRDVWSCEAVKEIITANFIFLQIYCDTSEGQKFISCYNVLTYPFVAIIDPRTGEKLKEWSRLDVPVFCEAITNFLSDQELPIDPSLHSDQSNDDDVKFVSTRKANGAPAVKFNAKEATEKLVESKKNDIYEIEEEPEDNFEVVETDSSSNDSYRPSVKANNIMTQVKEVKKVEPQATTSAKAAEIEKKKADKKQETAAEANHIPQQLRYETQTAIKDCCLRIMMPNGDRLDFLTDGEGKIKILIEYLNNKGYRKPNYELIERTMSNLSRAKTSSDTSDANEPTVKAASRDIFSAAQSSTFKQLNLYPRVFLLIQEV